MEDVAGGRIIDDDGFLQVSSHLTQILDIIALVVVAAFPEEPMVDNVVYIQLVEERVTVLGHRGGEDHHFVDLAHSLEKCIDAGPFYDIDVVVLAFDLDGNSKICLVEDLYTVVSGSVLGKKRADMNTHLETAVNQCFVQIEYETFASLVLWSRCRQKPLGCPLGG